MSEARVGEAMYYLRREVQAERERVLAVVTDPLQQARALDLLEFFSRRLDVAQAMVS